jgi:2-polyprenyl-3-methyl-5-hydroxy-6-metoxy-1,4-benzoquinol methylase
MADIINVKCNLCGRDDYTVIYDSTIPSGLAPTVEDYTSTVNKYGSFHRLVSCRHCGLTYANPRDAHVVMLYRKVVDKAYLESWEERAATFKDHLKILSRYNNGGHDLLDLGCYAGIFLDEAKKLGYNTVGVEPSEWAADHARRKTGANVLCGSWDEVLLPEDCFDIVTMWDIVEHLEDPSACFKKVRGWLKKGGIVAVATHNIKGWFARLTRRKYPWLMRFHLYHFEPRTLAAMLLKNGLKPILTRPYLKTITLKYFLTRFGIKTSRRLFDRIRLSFNTGDMFMTIARKE